MKYSVALVAFGAVLAGPIAAQAEGPEIPADTQKLADLLRSASDKPRPAASAGTAAAADAAAKPSTLETYGPIKSMAGWAIGIGAILLGAAFVARRLKDRGMFENSSKELRVEESLWVGKGQRILLLSVAGRRVLVGVMNSGFEGIAVLDEPTGPAPGLLEAMTAEPIPVSATVAAAKFADVVKDELVSTFKPTQNDRRRIIERLNTL